MKIKKITFIVSLIVIISIFYGCTKSEIPKLNPKNPVSITIWHYYNGPQKIALDKSIVDFNDTVGRDKGIIVDAVSLGGVNELTDGMISSAKKEVGAEELPDMFAAYTDVAFELDKMDKMASLNNYFTDEELDEYVDSYIEEGIFYSDGIVKIFPTAKSTEVLFLNKTDWNNFINGISGNEKYNQITENDLSTWEGIIKISETYYNWTDDITPDIANDGKSFFGLDSEANYLIIACKQLGYDIIDIKDGKGSFEPNKEVLRKIWDTYYVPNIKGYFNAVGRFRSDDTKVGYILASIGSTSSSMYFPTAVTLDDGSSYDIDSSVYTIPVFEGKEKYCVQQGAGMGIIKSTPEREYASSIFLKWLTEPQNNLNFVSESGYMPVKKISLEQMDINDDGTNSIVPKVMDVSAKQIATYKSFSSKPFDGGIEARRILETSFETNINNSKNKLEELIKSGMTREEAISSLISEESFDSWLEELTQNLKKALES